MIVERSPPPTYSIEVFKDVSADVVVETSVVEG